METRLLKTLDKLGKKEFKLFKWHLKQDNILEGQTGIPVSKLEKANRHDTVDQMIHKYQHEGALELTKRILKEMDMNELERTLKSPGANDKAVEGQTPPTLQNFLYLFVLKNYWPGIHWLWKKWAPPSDGQTHKRVYQHNVRQRVKHRPKLKTQESKEQKVELHAVQLHAVEVTLDRNTAHPNLILSDDGKRVRDGDVRQRLPYDRRRFTTCVSVLGEQGFSSGRFYFQVQVTGKVAWTLGVAAESIERKGEIMIAPDDGFWTIRLRDHDEYTAADNSLLHLQVDGQLDKVGVFVDYEEGLVSFYNADTADHLYSFTRCLFTEKLFPYISPCCNYDGTNSAPLIMCPVNQRE